MDGLDVTYLGALTAGVLSFLSPCILPIVPPYLCFIGGVSLDQLEGQDAEVRTARMRVFWAALAFVLGFGTVFVALGAGAAMAGNVVSENMHILAPIAGGIIILLGLHFLGLFRISMLYREARFHVESKPVGLIGAYLVGLAFAFGWTPCVGPVLAAILMVAGSSPSPWTGASLLGAYAVGIGVPFLLAALAIGPFLRFMARFRRYMGVVEKGIGGLLVLTGILIMTGGMADVAQWMIDAFPSLGQVG
ncbi:cytochrome c biogenesis CcdA family protein [Roseospira visakhapatnamensis]|uniref:Cytochrome c-type biogenesis protein n=1 Tax=Roseospira visakhapatnamensis TaxID=390880 RepID=A0A7W6RC61_9PROT|nr:cytochrome c biogenesis protein CcdA [Roseospira visakhapatnamensis]MBB4265710.1 cytochrome c-type biogenesis protein [Roseospira visakhapatnamensis]